MDNRNIPKLDKMRDISEATNGWGWVDRRIIWFWDDMTQHEIQLYFYLLTVADRNGCSWHSSRKMTSVLKIGPASLIKARKMLEERGLIGVKKDEMSQRVIYQILSLPIEANERVEIPLRKQLRKKSLSNKGLEDITPDQHEKNLEHLQKISHILGSKTE